jgi:hypothetical protein
MFHACRLEARRQGTLDWRLQLQCPAIAARPGDCSSDFLQTRYSLVQREIEDEILLLPEGRNWGHRLFPDGFWSVDRRHALRACGESTQR